MSLESAVFLVAIEFISNASGEIGFVCGMNMLRGTLVVE
jgi:plastocyanin domain-containing protein